MAATPASVAGPARTDRAVRYGCGAALAIFTAFVAAVTGGVLLIMQWVNADGSRPVAPAIRVPITGSVVLLRDGVTLVYSDPHELCGTANLSAAETQAGVTLSLQESDDTDQGTCPSLGNAESRPVPPFDPAAAILPPDAVLATTPAFPATVTLNSPLRGRRLVDASTGRAIPVFVQVSALRLAASGWMPAFPTGDISSAVPYFGGPGAAVLADNLIGIDPRTHQPSGWSLTVVQVTGGGWHPPAGTVTRRVIVRGHDGVAAAGIIVWTEAGRTVAVIGQGPAPRLSGLAGTFRRAPMPFAKLLAIADELHKGRSA